MALSVFFDPEDPPPPDRLAAALGKASAAWKGLVQELLAECAPLREEWGFAGPKFGWSLRLKRGTRVVVYLTPCAGHFLASFALGEKAWAAARAARLPAAVLTRIEQAPKYAEGRGVRIPVRTAKEAAAVRKLAAIKLAH